MRPHLPRTLAILAAPALALLAGCGVGGVTAGLSNGDISISPGVSAIDTNCAGCNATSPEGRSVHQFTATFPSGAPAAVSWSVSGGDPASGPGVITSAGQYTPPSYLTADRALVTVTATQDSGVKSTAVLTVTPGFLQPLTPQNVALGANEQVTITGFLTEAGGNTGIQFSLASSPTGSSGGQGSLGPAVCQRGGQAFTFCTVNYSAPASVSSTGVTYVVATVSASQSKTAAAVLLNTAGVSSNPAAHQAQTATPAALGSSGGNNSDHDTQGNRIVDCCGGTLGSLVQDSRSRQYLLSNNHVLARSDHAGVDDTIVQPGLIDDNCTPFGDGGNATPVGALTGWLNLGSRLTNADAAIAQVASGAVDPKGSILELGARQPDGTLAAAPPGISSTFGRGEPPSLDLQVAKSGRTTGLTCSSITALYLDVNVDYYTDCAETRPYLTKTYTNQLAIGGNEFSDAGDSGSLVVDTANAEPVGLLFAGGIDASGVSQGVANPVADVLNELSTQVDGGTPLTFVGAADHPVACLNYGDNTVAAAQARTLADSEIARGQQALAQARMLVNPSAGILGVATGKSSDHPGEAAVIVYVDEGANVSAPATLDGVRTLVIPTNAHAVAFGSAPQTPFEARPATGSPGLTAGELSRASALKMLAARSLMRQNSAFFGMGVGQSLDNPREPALVIYVDRKKMPAQLPATMGGLRTRYVVMDRLHVTRSYAAPLRSRPHCMPHPAPNRLDPLGLLRPRSLKLN